MKQVFISCPSHLLTTPPRSPSEGQRDEGCAQKLSLDMADTTCAHNPLAGVVQISGGAWEVSPTPRPREETASQPEAPVTAGLQYSLVYCLRLDRWPRLPEPQISSRWG